MCPVMPRVGQAFGRAEPVPFPLPRRHLSLHRVGRSPSGRRITASSPSRSTPSTVSLAVEPFGPGSALVAVPPCLSAVARRQRTTILAAHLCRLASSTKATIAPTPRSAQRSALPRSSHERSDIVLAPAPLRFTFALSHTISRFAALLPTSPSSAVVRADRMALLPSG